MRRHRVRLEGLAEGERILHGPAAHHLARVLRVRPGARIAAFDGAGSEASGTVRSIDGEAVCLHLEAPGPATTEADRAVTLAPALLKGDKLADVVRMATELGVVAVRPVRTRRCDVREVSPARLTRWRRVAEEAARQSGRARVPDVDDVVALERLEWTGALWIADPLAEATLADAMADLDADRPGSTPTAVTIVTGPEGGLAPDEVGPLVARGGRAVALGRRVLRAETAPVAVAAALLTWDGT